MIIFEYIIYAHSDLLKTPLILALSPYNSKMSLVTPIFCYQIVINIITCNFLQSLNKFYEGGLEPPLNFRNFMLALNPLRYVLNIITFRRR